MRTEVATKVHNEDALLGVVKAARGLLMSVDECFPDDLHNSRAALRSALANLDRLNP